MCVTCSEVGDSQCALHAVRWVIVSVHYMQHFFSREENTSCAMHIA